jgi:hypothetical protein
MGFNRSCFVENIKALYHGTNKKYLEYFYGERQVAGYVGY